MEYTEKSLQKQNLMENYFANLNGLSRKISLDIKDIKSSYEHIWDSLNIDEQIDIINETIIKPELTLKYFDNFSTSSDSFKNIIGGGDGENSDDGDNNKTVNLYDGKNLCTFQSIKTGRKVINDESVGLYRDEYSAPFNFKTKSQINLNIFETDIGRKQLQSQIKSPKSIILAKTQTKTAANNVIPSEDVTDSLNGIVGINDFVANADLKNILLTKNLENNLKSGPNFLSKFICKNNLIFTPADDIETSLENDDDDTPNDDTPNDDKKKLFSKNRDKEAVIPRPLSSSNDEDDKNYDELNSLLGNSQGFDFLNNW